MVRTCFVFDVSFNPAVAWAHPHKPRRFESRADAVAFVCAELPRTRGPWWRDIGTSGEGSYAVPTLADADTASSRFAWLARIDRVEIEQKRPGHA